MPIPTDQVDRLLCGQDVSLELAPLTDDGGLWEFDSGASISVQVTDGAGDSAGTAITGTLGADLDRVCVVVPESQIEHLDTYTITWTVETTIESVTTTDAWTSTLEICGGHLFTVAAFRALGIDYNETSSVDVRAARRQAEDRFEDAAGVAFVPRGSRERLRGNGRTTILVDRPATREIYSASIDGTALTVDELAAVECHEGGILERSDGSLWTADEFIDVHYAHGYDRPTADVVAAVKTLARHYATEPVLPERAVLQSTDLGTFRLTTAGRDGPTGIPDVDVIIAKRSRRRYTVG